MFPSDQINDRVSLENNNSNRKKCRVGTIHICKCAIVLPWIREKSAHNIKISHDSFSNLF